MLQEHILPLIQLAIKEDIGAGDVTSKAIFSKHDMCTASIIAKDNGIFCGKDALRYVYASIDKTVSVDCLCNDGDPMLIKQTIASIKGPTISVLAGERIALNFIQRLTGIATSSRYFSDLVKNTSIKILDTRKTLPGFRMLDKYAVKTGGGTNHRIGLYDMVMIKDNHIKAAGSITNAVAMIKNAYASSYQIEVETTNLSEVREALQAGVDIIMLDNMNIADMQQAIEVIQGRTKIEISGNINSERIQEIVAHNLNIDFISIGALTHTVKAFDFSMKFN